MTRLRFLDGHRHQIEIRRSVEEHEYDPLAAAAMFGNWAAAERLIKAGAKRERFVVCGPWECTIDGRPASLAEVEKLLGSKPISDRG